MTKPSHHLWARILQFTDASHMAVMFAWDSEFGRLCLWHRAAGKENHGKFKEHL